MSISGRRGTAIGTDGIRILFDAGEVEGRVGEIARRISGDFGGRPPVLIGSGRSDAWYTREKMDADLAFLENAGAPVTPLVFDGGHEWTDDFRAKAGRFLGGLT